MKHEKIRPAPREGCGPTITRKDADAPKLPCEPLVRKPEVIAVIARDDGSSLVVESTHYGARIAFASGRQRPAFVAIRASEIVEVVRALNRCTSPSRRRRFT